jgi:wyosine [tRNA(Phe)-imidazoG37] synthetase (radical SAM superfamily)
LTNKRVYGPVPSRRYGLSLGIDLVPAKACPYDCVYCQVGPTTDLTCEPQTWFAPESIVRDVEQALRTGPQPGVLTLAGSGEPTLYASLEELLVELKSRFGLPVVLLTNGALLHLPEVARAVRLADVLAPSLDAGDPETFTRINRPHPDLDFETMVAALRAAVSSHPGEVRLEIMVVPGANDNPQALARIEKRIADLKLASIDLNTPVRPAPGRSVQAVAADRMQTLCGGLGRSCRVIAAYGGPRSDRTEVNEQMVLEVLSRRPCTLADLQASLGACAQELERVIERLVNAEAVHSRTGEQGRYYFSESDEA